MLFKQGRHCAGHTCPYSRLGRHQALPTVVTKPRLESARIIHPTADHVLTVRAMARVQGFPDWYVLVSCLPHQLSTNPNYSQDSVQAARGKRGQNMLLSQYRQVGNSVAPPLAKAMGRCLLAALGPDPPPGGQAVVWLPDREMQEVRSSAGLGICWLDARVLVALSCWGCWGCWGCMLGLLGLHGGAAGAAGAAGANGLMN